MLRWITALLFLGLVIVANSNVQGEVAPAAPGLTVMSFNMWHKDRPKELKAVAEHLRGELAPAPDFILCQEVVFGRDGALDNTAAVLADALGYQCRGTKRTSDHEGVAIISKYPFEYYEARNLKSQTLRILLGFRRVSIMGEFTVPNLGRVRVVDVHLTNWEFEHGVRRKQLAETLAWVKQRQEQHPCDITIFGGDFNAKPWWDEMKQIKSPGAFGNLAFRDFNSQITSYGLPGTPNKRIDNLFVYAPELGVKLDEEKLFWRDGLRSGDSHFYVSDHMLLMHRYAFQPQMGTRVARLADKP